MNTRKIKTMMLNLLGESATAVLHGLRFAYMLKFCDRKLDAELNLLPGFLNKGDVAVDVGANGADWTYHLGRVVGKEGRIFAFEADPYYAHATEAAVKILGLPQVSFFRFGLSNREEDVALRVTDSSGLRESGLGHVDRGAGVDEAGVAKISLRTLDSLLADHPELEKTTLIKCDVEGYELFVLQGAEKIIDTARPIIIIETGAFQQQGYSADDIRKYLEDSGYDPHVLIKGMKIVALNGTMDHEDALTINRIFIPREKKADLRLE